MGHYTEVYLKATLKDPPSYLIDFFDKRFKNIDTKLPVSHEFFSCHHADSFFCKSAWYETTPYFKKLQQKELYQLLVHTEVKNFDNAIQKFLELIKPYLTKSRKKKGKYLGYFIIQDAQNTDQNHIYIENLGVIE